MGFLFFKLYNPCGLFNQVTSLELAVGLSSATSKKLVLHGIYNPPDPNYNNVRVPIYSANNFYNNRSDLIDNTSFPNIADLLVWNNKDETIMMSDTPDLFLNSEYHIDNLMEYYFSKEATESENENMFSEERKKFPINYKNISVSNTLGYYSRFFFNRTDELNNAISSVKFFPEYYELAKRISESLGSFNGAHIRLGDHKVRGKTKESSFFQGIEYLSSNLPVVVCTDEPDHPVIKNNKSNILILEEYILNNFYDDFKTFRFTDEVSFGILNNLVMHYSNDFIGTKGSTFSGYIQRNILQKQNGNYEFKIFEEDYSIVGNPYSWNGYDNLDTITKQWWREWKESFI